MQQTNKEYKMSILGNFEAAAAEEQVTIHTAYSGRGMYGQKCFGISGDPAACKRVISSVLKALAYRSVEVALDDESDTAEEKVSDLVNDFENWCEVLLDYEQDSLGLGVILYWRDLNDEVIY
jgi:hypothetical protein